MEVRVLSCQPMLEKPYIKTGTNQYSCCGRVFSSQGVKAHYQYHHLKQIHLKHEKAWNKGLTKETDARVKKNGDAVKTAILTRGHAWTGRKHKTTTKLLLQKTGGYKPGIGRSRKGWYTKLTGEKVFLQSPWEFCLASKLDEVEIEWEKVIDSKAIWIDNDGNWRRYIPDFHLPILNLYLDPKGSLDSKTLLKIHQAFGQISLTVLPYNSMIEVLQLSTANEIERYLVSKMNLVHWNEWWSKSIVP